MIYFWCTSCQKVSTTKQCEDVSKEGFWLKCPNCSAHKNITLVGFDRIDDKHIQHAGLSEDDLPNDE